MVGLEREWRRKAAGLRTTTLVGVSAALFMLISKYGFNSVLAPGVVVLDPSRVAAQVVSGIGFIGGGVIFMRRNVVRGLTTAASVWLAAALGMACGAGLPVLAVATTAGRFVIMLVFPRLTARLLPAQRRTATRLRVVLPDRGGPLRLVLLACSELRFAIDHVEIDRSDTGADNEEHEATTASVTLDLQVRGRKPIEDLVIRIGGIDEVIRVGTIDEDDLD